MEQLIQRLDLKDDKHLYSQLYRIRSEHIKNEEGIVSQDFQVETRIQFHYLHFLNCKKSFLKVDGIKKMTELLALRVDRDSNEVNDKMTEVLLSILGNCTCNNLEAAIQVSCLISSERNVKENLFVGI